jgi:hydroxymethylbilane synthase
MSEIRIATRRSALAISQARVVARMLTASHPGLTVSLVEVETAGDLDQLSPIADLTETGAFVRSVQRAVADGRAELAVHSLKDLPVSGPGDPMIAAYPERAAPYDVMVGSPLAELSEGAVVGTGSPRRAAQLRVRRPDLRTVELRGNVDTRLRKVESGELEAAVLAEAGLQRLGRTEAISERLDSGVVVPAPGQGALAVEARPGTEAAELAAGIDDEGLRPLLTAERELLALTGAGCRSSLGALATWDGGSIRMEVFVADEWGPRYGVVTDDDGEAVVRAIREEMAL